MFQERGLVFVICCFQTKEKGTNIVDIPCDLMHT